MWKYTDYKGNVTTFSTEDEIENFIRKNGLFLFDECDIENYVDGKYSAHEIFSLMEDGLKECKSWDGARKAMGVIENTVFGIYEEAESSAWNDRCNGVGPAEGSDWKFDEEVFIWVDDSEEDE